MYFINQTSLKGQINNQLTSNIINLIIDNQNVYNFLNKSPLTLTTKNYSLNWIFDKSNRDGNKNGGYNYFLKISFKF